jgi:hypothetical protein
MANIEIKDVLSTLQNLSTQIEQLKADKYSDGLKMQLLLILLYEHGALPQQELDKRWVPFLIDEIGAPDQNGRMKGLLKVSHYGV